MKNQMVARYLGLCAASRSLVCGCELALGAVRKNPNKVYLMLLAADASERTAKQVRDKCAYYKIELISLEETMEDLSAAVGKNGLVSAMAVTNKGLAEKIIEHLR